MSFEFSCGKERRDHFGPRNHVMIIPVRSF